MRVRLGPGYSRTPLLCLLSAVPKIFNHHNIPQDTQAQIVLGIYVFVLSEPCARMFSYSLARNCYQSDPRFGFLSAYILQSQ